MGANVGIPSSEDLFLLHEGSLFHSYRILGAHVSKEIGHEGVRFAVWAPHARTVFVLGDFNDWQSGEHTMEKISSLGLWMIFIPEAREGDYYKFEIHSQTGQILLKADPYAFYSELRPGTASRVVDLEGYEWQDQAWQQQKKEIPAYNKPLSIYEVHLGTWRKKDRKSEELYTYEQLTSELVDYAVDMGYTHIEVMPLAEHPFDRSWGYQATGYFSVTSRHGAPKDFMRFVDRCHQKGIGVIMDWVPGHFCKDSHGLRQFDGKPLYEYEDPRKAEKLEWGTLTFDFGRPEVQSFLISNALFWMDMYHMDGIRVDAVASMLHLNFGRWNEEPIHNQLGGDENLEAVAFIRKLNQVVFSYYPDALMMAEDSTDWPLVTAPVHEGGLGFNYKWNMGWMNDMLKYMKLDPIHRRYNHKLITFSFMYAWSENYVLPLSHDEVVHGKRSLLHKMPGDYWQKFANLRVLYGYMSGHPGKKLLFMGSEFGQFDEWKDLEELDWFLLDGYEKHEQMHHYVKSLNQFYLNEPALWQLDHDPEGFAWINPHDESQSVVTYLRKGKSPEDELILVCNFTPVVHPDYRIGVPKLGLYEVVFNSDATEFGGSGQGNTLPITSKASPMHGMPYSLSLCIPPLAAVYIKCVSEFQSEIDEGEGGKSNMRSKECVAMLLAGGEGRRLGVLTNNLAKPAVHFGGKYRIIDFTLSNCTNSGIDTVGVLTQYQPLVLNTYIGIGSSWDLDRKYGGVTVLPPFMEQKGGDWYKGTANAIYRNIGFIEQYDPEYVLVISGDHIYKMDYDLMLSYHKEKKADATIAVIEVKWEETSRFGIMSVNEKQEITEFAEKPKEANSNLASMGIYIFNWKVLKSYLLEDEANTESSKDFGKDIIPMMLKDEARMFAYPFQGYWKDVGTIDSLWEANMDLLDDNNELNLNDKDWRVYSQNPYQPAQYVAPTANIKRSLVNEGCAIFGDVDHSVLFFGVQVGEGSQIKDSVIMPNAKIGNNVTIIKAIIGENTVVEDGAVVDGNGEIVLIGGNERVTGYANQKG